MSDKRGGDGESLDRIFRTLGNALPGLHDLDPPNERLPSGLPAPLIALYGHCDGGRVYVDSLHIVPSHEVARGEGRWTFATSEGCAVAIDAQGRIWRTDDSIEDSVCEGTRVDRWLAGEVDALAMIYDEDGEFAEDVFDDEGEIAVSIREKQLRARLKRDAGAPGPRWNLARLLLERGETSQARDQLEQVVAEDPSFAWAWLDLAQVSEQLGDLRNAVDESRTAADVASRSRHPQSGYFWAQVARFAMRADDEATRADAAQQTSQLAPGLKQMQIEGARESLAAGDPASANGLLELLRAVWPRDLEVLDLEKRLKENKA